MSDTPTIEQMNVEMARFEGRKWMGKYTIDKFGGNTGNAYPVMKYHSSWDWLMPVYHAIREKAFALRNDEKANIFLARLNTVLLYGTIADVHLRAFHFIEYVNKQQSNEQDKI